MKHNCCISVLLSLSFTVSLVTGQSLEDYKLTYPNTRKTDHIDDYHGTPVADPFRWLEESDSEEIEKWVTAQNRVTKGFLDRIPQRKQIERRLTELWNHERFGLPRRNVYFNWLKNIQPWCISRQLWWGHQIPAWYGQDGKIFVEESETEDG